jgi:sigma-E factor negative regulatory protein RseA
MNEDERSSQVSALFDGELDAGQVNLVTRRLLKDPSLRASWSRYAMISASLRGDPLSTGRQGRGDVASRVRTSIDAEAPLVAADGPMSAAPRTGAPMRSLAWGSALAAGVAVVAILALRVQGPVATGLTAAVPAQQPAVAVPAGVEASRATAAAVQVASRDTPAPSYTTPVDLHPAGVRLSAPLVNYVVAHSEYTTPVARFSPLSAVMTGNFDPAENTVEMTEAEVGARR